VRGFILGTGPSLNQTPVDKLRDEFTVGINRFNLLGLDWSPDWWVLVDVQEVERWWDWDDLFSRDSRFIFNEIDRPTIAPYGEGVTFVNSCNHHNPGDTTEWKWHLPKLCTRGGGVSIAIQTAVLQGCNPIYILGCDLYKYRGPDDVDINHFHPEYLHYKIRRSTGEEMIGPEEWERINRRLIKVHEMARDSAASIGVSIYNATIGGALEIYERVNIFEVLNGKA
jgi:hypothetical protein